MTLHLNADDLVKLLTPQAYMEVHDAAQAEYEAATPADFRYSATALRRAVDVGINAAWNRRAAMQDGAPTNERRTLASSPAMAGLNDGRLENPAPVDGAADRLVIALEMLRDKHSSPTGTDEQCGAWDMAQRLIGVVRNYSSTLATPTPAVAEDRLSRRYSELKVWAKEVLFAADKRPKNRSLMANAILGLRGALERLEALSPEPMAQSGSAVDEGMREALTRLLDAARVVQAKGATIGFQWAALAVAIGRANAALNPKHEEGVK